MRVLGVARLKRTAAGDEPRQEREERGRMNTTVQCDE